MFKKRIVILGILFVASVLCIGVLGWASHYKANLPTSFVRKIPPFKTSADQVKKLPGSPLFIAGRSQDHFYLGMRDVLYQLYDFGLPKLDTAAVQLTANRDLALRGGATVYLDSTQVCVFDGLGARVYTSKNIHQKISDSLVTPYFTAGIVLTPSSFLFRSLGTQKQNILIKQTIGDTSLLIKENILTKQVDGFFCTDGMLIKSPASDTAFYVYYYRNQFLALDTNLNILYKGKTLDTNSVAKIKVATIQSNKQTTLSAPPLFVNRQASANKKYLFIRSALRADNEAKDLHENATAIDVYAVKDGAYQFSFYIPDFAKHKLSSFQAYDDMIVALFDEYVYTLKLNF